MRISKIHKMVLSTLTYHPETRSDDALLYSKVLEKYYGNQYLTQPFIITLQDKSLPKIESVGRARRKCQELYPFLWADDNTQAARELKEEEFEGYARQKNA